MNRLLTIPEAEHFQAITESYVPNDSVLQQFRSSNFAIIAGPAGAGKDTLRDKLTSDFRDKYVPILSTTSRPMRVGERDGVTYHFRTIEEVEAGIQSREFFQAQLVHGQQVSCLHVDEIRRLSKEQIGLSILVVQTEEKLSEIKDDIQTIFIIPPDLNTLKRRMQADRTLDPAEIMRRLMASIEELRIALDRPDYYCLVSEDLSKLQKLSREYLEEKTKNPAEDENARRVIVEILNTLSK